MSPITRKIMRELEIKSDGGMFFDIFAYKQYETAKISPKKIMGVSLIEGSWGTEGSVLNWFYSDDGVEKSAKTIVGPIDRENKLVKFKHIEGYMVETYTTFTGTLLVDREGQNNLVTWICEYEKPIEAVEDPNIFMDFLVRLSKDIDTYQLKY